MQKLTQLDIEPTDEGFLLRLQGEEGAPVEFSLTADQLDALVDAADELLDEEEEDAFGAEDRG